MELLCLSILPVALAQEEEGILRGMKIKGFPFYIYHDAWNRLNHYCPSGWMGDYGDIKLDENWKKNPAGGKTCIKITYTAEMKQGAGWAGIYWQNPPNNWGTMKGGYDLTGAKKVFFYARGEKGGELIECKIGGITGRYPDSAAATSGVIELSKKWKLYSIDLSDLDLSYISGGFCVVFSKQMNPDGCSFYLDEIYYTDKDKPLKIKAAGTESKEKAKTKKRRRRRK